MGLAQTLPPSRLTFLISGGAAASGGEMRRERLLEETSGEEPALCTGTVAACFPSNLALEEEVVVVVDVVEER